MACYLVSGDGSLVAESGTPHRGLSTPSAPLPRPDFPVRFGAVFIPEQLNRIPANLPLLQELAQRGKTWDLPVSSESVEVSALAPACLLSILGRNSRLIGLLVLGQRRSEEPYSREDKQLLDSVASQAGIALENIHLAETMAQRIEGERRVAIEMDIARRVQARLFPQKLPTLETLEYVGGCIQA